MWSQFLKQSRSQRKLQNKNVIVLGNKHCGKRSVIESLYDISKTGGSNRKGSSESKIRQRGLSTAIDYSYLNVQDGNDPDSKAHSKLEIYMIEEAEHPNLYSQLANPEILKNSVFLIMLDFTTPWNFLEQLEKWVKFIFQLQKMAQIPISDLEFMAQSVKKYYCSYREPELDENGKIKSRIGQQQIEQLPLPEGVLFQSARVPLVVCVNKCDLQSQVLREESSTKILVVLYHLRNLCVKYGASLVYTSIRNNCNLALLYEYILHRAYAFPLKYKPEPVNEDSIFIPFGYDSPTLISDSVVKIDISKSYGQLIPSPQQKKVIKEEVVAEDDSKFFQKYINSASASSATTSAATSEKQIEKPQNLERTDVQEFFKKMLQGGNTARRETVVRPNAGTQNNQRYQNAQRQLLRHTNQIIQKKNEGKD